MRFRGVTRRGAYIVGSTTEPVASLVERKWRARWQSLEVYDDQGELAGAITINDRGRRIWWAEGAEAVA